MNKNICFNWLSRFSREFWRKLFLTSSLGLACAAGSTLQAGVLYQAESAAVFGAVKHDGYVDYINASGDYIEWTVSVPVAGTYSLVFKYAFGSGNRPLEIKVDGVVRVASLAFPGTGSTSNFHTVSTPVALTAGSHRIRATAIGHSGGNMDSLEVAGNTVLLNQAPVVNAGPDQTVSLSSSGTVDVTLAGSATDDARPVGAILTKSWTLLRGPNGGTVNFSNDNLTNSHAVFNRSGTWVLKLTASDSLLTTTDTVQITVNPYDTQTNGRDWMMVCQPDTQYLSAFNSRGFNQQTTWIASNYQTKKIKHIFHLGDMIDEPTSNDSNYRGTDQWAVAVNAMNRLAPALHDVAISLTVGNHDFDDKYNPNSSVTKWASRFGHNYRRTYNWYGGSSNTMVSEDRNHYCTFSAGGRTFLSIDLQFAPRDQDIAWANRILRQFPRLPTILGTHGYILDKSGNYDTRARGERVFNQVVFENPQIFLVVNGHSSEKGYGTTVRMARNRIGKDVIQMCCDFQKEGGHETKTGVSWIKLITFEMGKNNIHFQTYDPSSNSYIQPMVNNQPTRQEFNIPMDFASRFAL